jgi:thiol:disulfide interchange protein
VPFGAVFGFLYFGPLCVGIGIALLTEPVPRLRFAGLSLVVLGAALAIGLARRCSWARWAGVASSVVVALFAGQRVFERDNLVDLVLLFGSLATAVLLLLPATGRVTEPRRGAPALRWATACGVVGLAAAGLWLPAGAPAGAASGRTASELPAAARATPAARIEWTDFASGLERAKADGRPMVVTFVTDWCGYCDKMNRETWRSRDVIERLTGLVAVRIDAEETQQRNGLSGAELADRYGVSGFPSNFILAADGGVVARRDGYLSPSQFLAWLDRTPETAAAPSRAARAP